MLSKNLKNHQGRTYTSNSCSYVELRGDFKKCLLAVATLIYSITAVPSILHNQVYRSMILFCDHV